MEQVETKVDVLACDCKRPNVANMDHRLGDRYDSRPMVNRVCLTCGNRWYGDAGVAVFMMPRATWDRWMESGLARVGGGK